MYIFIGLLSIKDLSLGQYIFVVQSIIQYFHVVRQVSGYLNIPQQVDGLAIKPLFELLYSTARIKQDASKFYSEESPKSQLKII